ncbi:hypothetical protein CSA80_00785 [Candidatus Saccharibacteria bacterium]|nr:MAG: hypothetical protein CR973_02370 [Candidatus Saccharibacteria bacterium]PID99291.1 MAG: hypothetical protein CSA80_00785 [Candidatus Saccharibacteria bacterium]
MSKPTTVEEYLAALPNAQAKSLQDLREKILRNIPDVEEKIAFGKPFYYLGGKYVVSFAAAKAHNSFHTMSFDVAAKLPSTGKGWKVDGGSVKFDLDAALPESVVQNVIDLRLAEMQQ